MLMTGHPKLEVYMTRFITLLYTVLCTWYQLANNYT